MTTPSTMPPYALIFDLDGVLVDSNPLHIASWAAVAEKHHLPLANPDYIGKCGLRTLDVIRTLLHWPLTHAEAITIGEEKEALYRQWIAERGIPAIPGVVDYIHRAAARQIPLAIGSSAPKENVTACLQALKLQNTFQAILTGNDVTHGKPDPEIYLKAADRLHIPPRHCIVFEDAPAGIQSAHAAGAKAVGILTSHTPAELAAADHLVPDFTHLPLPPL